MAASGSNSSSDASRRDVLPPDAALSRNLAALWALDAGLAARIEALHPCEPYSVQASKAGPPTVAVRPPDGRSRFLYSRHDPAAEEQQRQVSRDIANVTGVAEAAAEFPTLVRPVIDRIASEWPRREAA